MKTVTRNEVGIVELFSFAEKKFGVGWNKCCDIFQRTEIVPFKGVNDYYLKELKGDIEHEDAFAKENLLAYQILVAFMEQNKVTTMRYIGTGN